MAGFGALVAVVVCERGEGRWRGRNRRRRRRGLVGCHISPSIANVRFTAACDVPACATAADPATTQGSNTTTAPTTTATIAAKASATAAGRAAERDDLVGAAPRPQVAVVVPLWAQWRSLQRPRNAPEAPVAASGLCEERRCRREDGDGTRKGYEYFKPEKRTEQTSPRKIIGTAINYELDCDCHV